MALKIAFTYTNNSLLWWRVNAANKLVEIERFKIIHDNSIFYIPHMLL